MRTKNIQQFRTSWRNQEGYNMSDWDENFIGSVHEGRLFGFYRMVNGIVENIKADLTPKLQNAQDEQAIYEFLQNAADSQSTECAVIYDENYFMVLNNGKPFTDKDLKALLNSFQGTKADKTKPENCGKIGRYGIGFKLAYRLMGKSDGADELLNNLAGPILYSWHNSKQFQDILNYKGEAVKNDDTAIEGNATPWLLKIILACFPTALGEEVFDLDHQAKVLFQNEELMEMVGFLNKHRERLEHLTMPQGSLFFLKFGPKKHEKLKESLLNIQSGIGYSMNTLKTLEKVVLQDVAVEKYHTDFERYSILPGTEDFLRIDPEFPFCPIEIALGFPKELEQMRALKRAPSIYQFFPMRNERHNMAYFIHGTSFSKITDRTRLDDQGEANIETFKYIAKTLKRNLTKYKQDNFDQYALVYRALLMTDKSDEYDADLINNHLHNPMLEFIRTAIPTHKKNFYLKDLVVVKGTRLKIDPMSLGIGKEWFFWHDLTKEDDLMREAANNAKLGLRRWGVKELILEGTAQLIDNWIESMSAEEYGVFVSELKDVDFDAAFLDKFQYVKTFRFSDNKGNVNFFSIKDLQNQQNVFLMSERTMPIREEIKALGFAVLEFNILDYSMILRQLEQQLDYLSNDRALYAKIAERTISANLTATQKHSLFAFMAELNGVRADELRKLPLFSNAYGLIVPLHSLLPSNAPVAPWFDGFKINSNEDAEVLQPYFAQQDSWEIYEYIIAPHWNDLVKHSALNNVEDLVALHEKVVSFYKLKATMPKLTEAKAVFVDLSVGFVNAGEVFYYKTLSEITDYEALRKAVQKVLNLHLPHPSVLEFLSIEPFRLTPTPSSKEWKGLFVNLLNNAKTAILPAAEKIALFRLLKTFLKPEELQKIELFENNKGERMPLSNLIVATEEVEPWLKNYQLKKTEDSDILEGFLASTADIYPNIIANQWELMIQDPEAIKNIAAFYRSIDKYAQLAKSVKPLITSPYVFVSKEIGFVTSTQLLYHPQMEGMENYNDLRKAVSQITGHHTPHPEVLPFLNLKPFKTRDGRVSSLIKNESPVLSREEVVALMQFMDKAKEDFFKVLTVEESDNNREFIVAKRTKAIPYYVDKSQQKLADRIQEAFGDLYKQLPHKLFLPELRNEGLLMGASLFNTLSKAKDASPELLSAMIVESGNADVQELVFGKIDKIVLKQGRIYDKDSFEHQALQIFRNKDADHSKVREKIYIEDASGNLFKLTDIAFDAAVSFSIERDGKYSLELAEILPEFVAIQALLDDILDKLVDYEAPTVLKRRCFEAEEKPLRKIFNELRHNGTTVDNASQLAFLLLMAKIEENNKILRDFSVLATDETAVSLAQFEAFHLNNNSFIHPQAILNSAHYAGLGELLRMSEGSRRAVFEFGNQKIVFEPYFDRGLFFCAPLQELDNDETAETIQAQILDFCYKKWANEDEPATVLELYTGDAKVMANLDLATMVFPDNYALLKEQVPVWLKDWLGKDADNHSFDDTIEAGNENEEREETTVALGTDKLSFLVVLGLNAHRSPLVKLRRYLQEKLGRTASQKQLNDIQNKCNQHLLNTVLWLQSEGTRFHSEDDRIHWLRKLYNTLDQITHTTPLPFVVSVEGKEEESFIYEIGNHVDTTLYYFDGKQQQTLRDKYEVTMAHVRTVLDQVNCRMTNIAIKNFSLSTSTIEEKLDVEHLQNESKEWAASHYLKWREEAPYRVNLYDGKIPYLLLFLGQVVKVLRLGNAVVHERNVFVNSHSGNIEEALFEVSSRNTLSELMLLQLLRFKNETEGPVSKHPVIEKVVEQVVVSELVADDEEIIENPEIDAIKAHKEKETKGQLKMAFDLRDISSEMLDELMKLAKSTRMIVPKNSVKKED